MRKEQKPQDAVRMSEEGSGDGGEEMRDGYSSEGVSAVGEQGVGKEGEARLAAVEEELSVLQTKYKALEAGNQAAQDEKRGLQVTRGVKTSMKNMR